MARKYKGCNCGCIPPHSDPRHCADNRSSTRAYMRSITEAGISSQIAAMERATKAIDAIDRRLSGLGIPADPDPARAHVLMECAERARAEIAALDLDVIRFEASSLAGNGGVSGCTRHLMADGHAIGLIECEIGGSIGMRQILASDEWGWTEDTLRWRVWWSRHNHAIPRWISSQMLRRAMGLRLDRSLTRNR